MFQIRKLISLTKSPIAKSVGIYTFSNFCARGASFVLLIVFTNPLYILPAENCLLSLFSNSMLFLMPFLSMGIIHSTSTDFFKLDKQAFSSFFTTGMIMPLAVMIISMTVFFFFREYIHSAYGFPYMFIWLIPLVTYFSFCNEQMLNLARNNNEPMTFLRANIFKTVLELGLSFILVVGFFWRWEGRVAGILISSAVIAIYAFYYFIKKGYLFGKIRKEYIINELIYAVPIIVLQAAIFAMNASDKFFLAHFTSDDNETVGIYSVACIFASIVVLFSSALIQYVFPRIYALLSAETINYLQIRKYFLFYLGGMAVATVLIIVITPLMYHFFINERYHAAIRYNYILCIGYFVWSVSYFFFSFLLYNKQKRKIFLFSLCCIAVSMICNYFFIRQGKDFGAALSVATCFFIVLVLTLLFTKEYWQQFLFYRRNAGINQRSKI